MKKGNVLVVEDNTQIGALAAEYLRLEGFEVSQAMTSDEALSNFTGTTDFDVLFIDVRIPGTFDGIGLAQQFRQIHPDIPILICSGYGAQRDLLIAELGPPSSYLPKPYSLAEMGDILTRMVGGVAPQGQHH